MQILYLLCIIGILVPALSSTFDEPDFSDENSSDFSVKDLVLQIPEYDLPAIPEILYYFHRRPVLVMDYNFNASTNLSDVDERHFFLSDFLNPQLLAFKYENISSQDLLDSNNTSEIIFPVAGLYVEYSYNPHPLYGLLEIERSQASTESVQGHSLQDEKTENEHQLSSLSELSGSQVSAKSMQEESIKNKEDLNIRHVNDGDNKFEKRKEESLQVDKTSKSEGNKLQNAETSDDSLNEPEVNSLSQLSGYQVSTMSTEEHSIEKKTTINYIQINDEEFELANRKDETSQEYNFSKTEENNLWKVHFFEDTNNKRHLNPILELLRPQNHTESAQKGLIQEKKYLNSMHISDEDWQLKNEKNETSQLYKAFKSKEKSFQNLKVMKETNYGDQINPLSKLSESQANVEKTQMHSIQKKDTDNKYQLNALSELSEPQSSTESSQDESTEKKENRNIKQANDESYEFRKIKNEKKQINQTMIFVENKLPNGEASESSVNDSQLNPLSELSDSQVHTVSTQKLPTQKTENINNKNDGKYEATKEKEEINEVHKASQSEE